MSKHPPTNEHKISLRELYPHLDDENLQEAEQNLNRYLELSVRIYNRILNDPEAYQQFRALKHKAKDL